MEAGILIGPYRVEDLLGRGGMAEVYKVWHSHLHRHEAMKLLPNASAVDAAFVQRFLMEAQFAARLHHPHIVTIHSVSDGSGPPYYFSMQLVEGGDLADLLNARGRLPLRDTLPILKQIASALDYAHRHGVIHRDIKPGNILIESDDPMALHRAESADQLQAWNVKVVDFGIARALGEGGATRLTHSGMFVGTPEYMSPEQAGSGSPIDHRTDIYAMGVIAYEMLCGRPPFRTSKDTSPLSVVVKHLNSAPPSPQEFFPALSSATCDVLLKALAKDPLQRYESCLAFVEALTSTLGQNAEADSTPVEDITALRGEVLPPQENNKSTPLEGTAGVNGTAVQGAGSDAISPGIPDTGAKPATETPRAPTINTSLYSLFNETDAAQSQRASAFSFPAEEALPPLGTEQEDEPVKNENEVPSASAASALQIASLRADTTIATPDPAIEAIAPISTASQADAIANMSTPVAEPVPVAPPKVQPRQTGKSSTGSRTALIALLGLLGLALVGFGWWRTNNEATAEEGDDTSPGEIAPQLSPPELAIIEPGNGSELSFGQKNAASGTARHNSGVRGITVRLARDGEGATEYWTEGQWKAGTIGTAAAKGVLASADVENSAAYNSNQSKWFWPLPILKTGSYRLRVTAKAEAGGQAQNEISFTVTAPDAAPSIRKPTVKPQPSQPVVTSKPAISTPRRRIRTRRIETPRRSTPARRRSVKINRPKRRASSSSKPHRTSRSIPRPSSGGRVPRPSSGGGIPRPQ